MSMIDSTPANVNPRDTWPDWTDDDRWVATVADDEPRPTAEPEFTPTPEDDSEASDLLNGDDAEWDDFPADCPDDAFSDPYDFTSDHELFECRGYHPSTPYVL